MSDGRLRIVFMGSSAASAECLRAILREDDSLEVVGVVTQPDRPAGRGKALTPCMLAKFAASRGITEMIKPERVNEPEPMEWIRAKRPDVVAVVAFGQILKKPLLDLPPHGCVNCHFSLLPKYRGAAPVIAALEAGELAELPLPWLNLSQTVQFVLHRNKALLPHLAGAARIFEEEVASVLK